jgi:hypothetical protein
VSIDEALSKLDDNIRRLKIEYETYFNGGSPRPPRDTVFRVETAIKKYSGEMGELNFAQRFRFNQLAQKYAVYNDLWRRRLKDIEEGRAPLARRREASVAFEGPFRVVCADLTPEVVDQLLGALVRAKHQVGDPVENLDPARFAQFVRQKAEQVKQKLGCAQVQFSISIEEGKVRFTAGKA